EAAAYTLSRMPEHSRSEALSSYFDRSRGLGYGLGRVPIHSCDFSLANYTYVAEGDETLESFSLEHEERWLFPMIRDAEAVRGGKIPLLASPWSPPGWMKTNGEMNNGGALLPQYRELWARYLVRYAKEMKGKGFDLWALTVQNEPAAVQTWESCIYTADEERDFVRDFLGPMLHTQALDDVKLLILDHNRDIMVERVKGVLSDPEAARFVWGVGFHWYMSEAFENVGAVHDLFPDTHLLFTEGCQEGGVHLGSWKTGERYARNMIGDFNNWCEGYLDWNLVLDEMGGPNHVNNLCDAPIIADTRSGELHYNSSYYAIGHFSRYVAHRSRRVGIEGTSALQSVAFENPDGSIALVMLNGTDEEASYDVSLAAEAVDEPTCARGTLAPHAIATIVWEPTE
ncbi:MAG: glycoside hydrolase family 30 protein, partial [Spirochaetota bacterium]